MLYYRLIKPQLYPSERRLPIPDRNPIWIRTKDELGPGKSIQIEHQVSQRRGASLIHDLVRLSPSELKDMRDANVNAEQLLYQQLKDILSVWDDVAAQTMRLDLALTYFHLANQPHTSNEWVVIQDTPKHGAQSISNRTFRMDWEWKDIHEWHSKLHYIGPVWYLTWSLDLNSPTGFAQLKKGTNLTGKEAKRFFSKDAMERYLHGRIAVYAHLFNEVNPPIPPKCIKHFMFDGLLIPGYSIAEDDSILKPRSAAHLTKGKQPLADALSAAKLLSEQGKIPRTPPINYTARDFHVAERAMIVNDLRYTR